MPHANTSIPSISNSLFHRHRVPQPSDFLAHASDWFPWKLTVVPFLSSPFICSSFLTNPNSHVLHPTSLLILSLPYYRKRSFYLIRNNTRRKLNKRPVEFEISFTLCKQCFPSFPASFHLIEIHVGCFFYVSFRITLLVYYFNIYRSILQSSWRKEFEAK